MIRGPPRSPQSGSSAASDVYKRQLYQIVRSIKEASGHITETESVVKERSNDSRINSKEIANAVNNVSQGAHSQAEQVQDAVDAIQVMDHMIDQMQQKIFDMTKLSDEMTEDGQNDVSNTHLTLLTTNDV